MTYTSFSCLVGAVLSPGQLLPCPKWTVADLYQNICGSVLLCNVTKSLKEAEAYPTWVQSTLAPRLVCSDYFVVSNMVYVHVGQSTIIACVGMCVWSTSTINMLEKRLNTLTKLYQPAHPSSC